jgi:histidyl-tRNA synthetase
VALLDELRRAGIAAQMDFDHPKVGRQFKSADTAGARFCAILGENEIAHGTVSLKDMRSGEQKEVAREQVAPTMKASLKPE